MAVIIASLNMTALRANVERLDPQSVVVIGSGVGALTTSIFLARSGLRPIIISGKNVGGALTQSSMIQNWPGEYEISGVDLTKKMQDQAIKNGVEFRELEVVNVDFSKRPFSIKTEELYDKNKTNEFLVDYCVIATGSEPNKLEVKGESEYWTKGVYSCAVCDGALYRGKTVAVVGGGDSAILDAQYLSQIAKKVYVIVRKSDLKANEKKRAQNLFSQNNVEFLFETQVKEIKGNQDFVTNIVLEKKSSFSILDVDAVFLAIGSKPNTELFEYKVPLDNNGYIVKDQNGKTSIDGVYAVGDVADPFIKQAITASGDGARAAIALSESLFQKKNAVQKDAPHTVTKSSLDMKKEKNVKTNSDFCDQVVYIKDYNQFLQEINNSKIPIVVDFYASWCGPCRHLSPKLDSYAKQLKGKVKILKVDVQQNSQLADRYKIRSMPTLIVLTKEGKEEERWLGVGEIVQYLESLR